MPSILFLTTTNLSCNPRLYKELQFAKSININCKFYAFDLQNWSKKSESNLLNRLTGIEHCYIDTGKRNKIIWLYASFLQRLCVNLRFLKSIKIVSYSFDKRSVLLKRCLKREKGKFDLVIAHNPGAFYAAQNYAARSLVPYIIDVEDYHPGEYNDVESISLMKFLMRDTLRGASSITVASPLIYKAVAENILNKLDIVRIHLINNLFSKYDFNTKEVSPYNADKVNFVWFSQIIDAGRGIEDILTLLDRFESVIELHLIGEMRDSFFEKHIKNRKYIIMHSPMIASELNKFLSKFDIGLALESTKADYNRSICLTNKIWSYFQAGLYIIATATPAQIQFIAQNSKNGEIIQSDDNEVFHQFSSIITELENIRRGRDERLSLAENINWEIESNKLQNIWRKYIA